MRKSGLRIGIRGGTVEREYPAMVLPDHDIYGSGPISEPLKIDPGEIRPHSRVGNSGQGDMGNACNGEGFIALQISTILRVPEYRIDNILVYYLTLNSPGPEVPPGIHDCRVKKRAAITGIIHVEFLIQVIGECDRAVVLRMAVLPEGKEGIIGTPRSRVNERIIPAGIPHITTGLPVICRKYGGIVTRSAGPLVTR